MHDPLMKRLSDKRTYKVKNAAMSFFCPLCTRERAITLRPRLNGMHYIQIAIISVSLIALTASRMGAYSIAFFFITWLSFEAGVRILFRKEVPCPYCGFDASWYKRDVKVAKRLVQEFWDKEAPGVQAPSEQDVEPPLVNPDLNAQANSNYEVGRADF